DTRIFASSDLEETRIADLVARGAPIDAFGVGAAISTSSDAPSLGSVYKLVEIEREGQSFPVMKSSPGKQTIPGRKQIWRFYDERGGAPRDIMPLAGEVGLSPSEPLLKRVMVDGRRERPREPLDVTRRRCRQSVAQLPDIVLRLEKPGRYPVELSRAALMTI